MDPNASPGELILSNDPSNMIFAFSPNQLGGIWKMIVFQDKLFIAACTEPMTVDDGEIISFDYVTNSFKKEYDLYEQGVIQMRTYNGKLYIPGCDSQGSWEYGNIYIYDGYSWTRKETVPHGIHVLDLIFYKGEMYVTTGTDLDNHCAILYKSADEGDSWSEVFVSDQAGRFYMMGVYNDTLYFHSNLQEQGGKVLYRFDGNNCTTISFDLLFPGDSTFEEFNNKFYFLNRHFLHIYENNIWETINLYDAGCGILYCIEYYDQLLYGGGWNGSLYSSTNGHQWQPEDTLDSHSEKIRAIEVYHGRLYVGTQNSAGQARVYVSSASAEGSLVSSKYDFGYQIYSGIISWNAIIPSNETSIKFQIRTSTAENNLDDVEFVGPDGTINSFYENSGESLGSIHYGHQWMQYKVYLTTSNSALSPILQDVNVSVSPSSVEEISGENQIDNFILYQNYPNPFNNSTTITYYLPNSDNVVITIYDTIGNEVATLVDGHKDAGLHRICWKAKDKNPSGVYIIKFFIDNRYTYSKKILCVK